MGGRIGRRAVSGAGGGLLLGAGASAAPTPRIDERGDEHHAPIPA